MNSANISIFITASSTGPCSDTPSASTHLTVQDAGVAATRSPSLTSASSSSCPSLFLSLDASRSFSNVTENYTPPESPGRTNAKLSTISIANLQDELPDIPEGSHDLAMTDRIFQDTSTTQTSAEFTEASSSTDRTNSFVHSVSNRLGCVEHTEGMAGSRSLVRSSCPRTLQLPPPNETGPFTTSPLGTGYGSPPPKLTEMTLSDIAEGSYEGSEAPESPREVLEGPTHPENVGEDIVILLTSPAQAEIAESPQGGRSPLTPPGAPLLPALELPSIRLLRPRVVDDIITPISPLPSPVQNLGASLSRRRNGGRTEDNYNPYFAVLDRQN